MTEILLTAVWVGLSSATLTCILRFAPVIHRWVLAGKKPWVCDVCMTLWTVALITTGLYYAGFKAALAASAPGYAIGKWMLMRLTDPQGPPPVIPPDLDEDEGSDDRPTISPPKPSEPDDTNTMYDPEKHGS
jgi:hypothetical protein